MKRREWIRTGLMLYDEVGFQVDLMNVDWNRRKVLDFFTCRLWISICYT
jgi:hypothetical protein